MSLKNSIRRTLGAALISGAALTGAGVAAAPANADAACSIGTASIVVRGAGSPYAASCLRIYRPARYGNHVTFASSILDTRTDGKVAVGYARVWRYTSTGVVPGDWKLIQYSGNESAFTPLSPVDWTMASQPQSIDFLTCAYSPLIDCVQSPRYLL